MNAPNFSSNFGQSDQCIRSGGPYRSRQGAIFGVCRGLAKHFEVEVIWLRLGFIVGFFMTGFWPAGLAYVLAAMLMKMEPVLPLETPDDAEFYSSYTTSKSMALHRVKRTYESLDRRIQRIEDIVTAPDYDWDQRLESGH
jgi:phage shock protein C